MAVFTIPEAAELLRRHPATIRRMIRRGDLGGIVRRGGGWVTIASIERLLGEEVAEATPPLALGENYPQKTLRMPVGEAARKAVEEAGR